MEKKKTYVLMLSQVFPKTHNKAGMPTEFKEKVLNKKKIHTIRANYHYGRDESKKCRRGERFWPFGNGQANLTAASRWKLHG